MEGLQRQRVVAWLLLEVRTRCTAAIAMEETPGHDTTELSSLLDNLPDAIGRFDSGLNCRYANRAAARLLGVPRESSSPGGGITAIRLPDDIQGMCRKVLKTGDSASLLVEDPTQHRYRVRIIPEFGPDGEVNSLLAVVDEVSNEPSAQGHEAQRGACGAHPEEHGEDGHFLGNLSHRLRTPLNVILGWTQTLKLGNAARDTVSRALTQIEESARAQARLIDELVNGPHAAALEAAGNSDTFLTESHAGPLAGIRILAVDDDSNTRDMLAEALARAGAAVTVAASASDALERLPLCRPDVLVSDIGMPEVDGLELLRRIRALPLPEHALVPAVALTGYAREVDNVAAYAAGYQAVTAKPVDLPTLFRTVRQLAR